MKLGKKILFVHLPDTRGVQLSRFGKGNTKIGENVFTYSKLPGLPSERAIGSSGIAPPGTCPGASAECLAICYARRPVQEGGPVYEMWRRNTELANVPDELPEGAALLRLHISGDFDSSGYIDAWRVLIARNPTVRVWAYTRSWRVPALLPALERLRELPNVQLFASVDKSVPELPPAGWRRAWIDGDDRALLDKISEHNHITIDGTPSLVCPEQTGRAVSCEACRYCFDGRRADVTFLEH